MNIPHPGSACLKMPGPGWLNKVDMAYMKPEKTENILRNFILLAALWLPLGFFLWFQLAVPLVFLVARLADLSLGWAWGEHFHSVVQYRYMLEINTNVVLDQLVEGRRAALVWDVNPMIYGYGIPLLFGLVLATPVSARKRLIQFGLGLAVMWMVQLWGVFWAAQRDLAFDLVGLAKAAEGVVPFSKTLVALCYQLGYLILPAISPVVYWILSNRDFIQKLVSQGTNKG